MQREFQTREQTTAMRHPLFSITGYFLFALVHAGAIAQSYPVKPVRLVVPLAPGGGSDLLARYVGKFLGEGFGRHVVVENRAGAGVHIE